jgi:hypothetical protein
MELEQLQEKNKLTRLNRVLREVFDVEFNFKTNPEKLVSIQEATHRRILKLQEHGVEVSDKNYQKLMLISEGISMILEIAPKRKGKKVRVKESQDLDQAEVLLAAKQLADDLQKMAENLASMQVEELMSIRNAMKEEIGIAEADAFNATAEAAISAALESVKMANDQVSTAVLQAQGMAPPTDMDPMAQAPMAGGDMVADMAGMEDEFAGADTASMETDIEGREMKEHAYLSALKMIKEAQVDGKVNSTMLQKAFNVMKLSEDSLDENIFTKAFSELVNYGKKVPTPTKPKSKVKQHTDNEYNANALEDPDLQKQIDDIMPDATIPHDDFGGDLIGQQLRQAKGKRPKNTKSSTKSSIKTIEGPDGEVPSKSALDTAKKWYKDAKNGK